MYVCVCVCLDTQDLPGMWTITLGVSPRKKVEKHWCMVINFYVTSSVLKLEEACSFETATKLDSGTCQKTVAYSYNTK